MDLEQKLSILSQAARYDVSCASSGSTRRNTPGGVGDAARSGVCHAWTADGRCVSLLKVLFTNRCLHDCAYCLNGASQDRPRAAFTPEELADLTLAFYRRNYIEGLFLSSGVIRSPDYTMELMIRAVRRLREEHRFNGYVHLKVIPGADPRLTAEAGRWADRLSVNIELPTEKSLARLAPGKSRESILGPMGRIAEAIEEGREKTRRRSLPRYAPAGQSTQLIVGASPEPDRQIVRLSESLYRRYGLKRVYYSAFTPVRPHPILPEFSQPPLLREHRLYQADWLIRYYDFSAGELLSEERPDLDRELDPKSAWALRNLDRFPVEVNRADYDLLLRVPGIGVRSAKRIVAARRHHYLDFEDLQRIGAVTRRARHFITCGGRRPGGAPLREDALRRALLAKPQSRRDDPRQLSLFDLEEDTQREDDVQSSPTAETFAGAVTGEL